MKQVIYISGPITDNATGLPREGWQKEFMEAEERLKDMGFKVINPTELATQAEAQWNQMRQRVSGLPEQTPRWYYLRVCIDMMAKTLGVTRKRSDVEFAGLYVIGAPDDIQHSYGTMTEINFALSAGLPVFSEYYYDDQMDNKLRRIKDAPTLADAAKQNGK